MGHLECTDAFGQMIFKFYFIRVLCTLSATTENLISVYAGHGQMSTPPPRYDEAILILKWLRGQAQGQVASKNLGYLTVSTLKAEKDWTSTVQQQH